MQALSPACPQAFPSVKSQLRPMRPHRLGQSLSTGASKLLGHPWARRPRGPRPPAPPPAAPKPRPPSGQYGPRRPARSGAASCVRLRTRPRRLDSYAPARAEPRRRALALTAVVRL